MRISICNGIVRFLYNEDVNLDSIGDKSIKRASFVEPYNNEWYVDFSPLGKNKVVNGFRNRSQAIKYEREYIENNIL